MLSLWAPISSKRRRPATGTKPAALRRARNRARSWRAPQRTRWSTPKITERSSLSPCASYSDRVVGMGEQLRAEDHRHPGPGNGAISRREDHLAVEPVGAEPWGSRPLDLQVERAAEGIEYLRAALPDFSLVGADEQHVVRGEPPDRLEVGARECLQQLRRLLDHATSCSIPRNSMSKPKCRGPSVSRPAGESNWSRRRRPTTASF